ncbi:MAG: hypothetical protein HOW97_21220 [Catenulispora sp.]|nr:hypothetical protein [Catenulispora sp.]
MTARTGDGRDPPPDKEVDVEHRRGRLTEAQQKRLLELLGRELRAAVARRTGGGGPGGGDADDCDEGDDALPERARGRRAAVDEYLETRRAALEQGTVVGRCAGCGIDYGTGVSVSVSAGGSVGTDADAGAGAVLGTGVGASTGTSPSVSTSHSTSASHSTGPLPADETVAP